ncbi:MAG: RNA polymerase Rpb4 family protein [Candidatus Thermoplasmatota archaeon]|nr:RNA polymerase Rpb4 family protein [Candidatus Thermoplasmatota archaeon]
MGDDKLIRYVPLAEVKNILKKVSKDRKELLYEQKNALEHAQRFAKLSIKKTEDMMKELRELKSLEEFHVVKIADLLPDNEDDVKAIFAKERISLSESNIKKILEIVKKYNVEE